MRSKKLTRILVATDGSRRSERAVRLAVALAAQSHATLVGVMTTPRFRFLTVDRRMSSEGPALYKKDSERLAKKALGTVKRLAQAARVRCTTRHIVEDDPYKAILQNASRGRCDLVVMGSHGHTAAAAALLGSQTSRVIARTRIPVLVCR